VDGRDRRDRDIWEGKIFWIVPGRIGWSPGKKQE